jgi:glycosyltransferase involved in cell wall biosynthesis
MKILSIIVPTYNMEDYLKRCLNSVLNHKWDEDLEVIVVNDGSTDRTLQIALTYKEKFPEIVTIMDKENGNYGSTINAALSVIQGKYVKILDADDWFDTNEFERFIKQLRNIESDLVISDFTINYILGQKKKKIFSSNKDDKIYDFSIMSSPNLLNLEMHAITYNTELLKKNNYTQTEGIFYTDQEWMFYPMFFVDRISFIKANVYQYLIGREGQTVDSNVKKGNISHVLIGIKKMLSDYSLLEKEIKLSKERKTYLLYRIGRRISGIYQSYLFQSNKDFNAAKMKEFDTYVRLKNKDVYLLVKKIGLNQFIPYINYWRKYEKRMPQWIIKMLLRIINILKSIQILVTTQVLYLVIILL